MATSTKATPQALATDAVEGVPGSDEKVFKNIYERTRAHLMAQPRQRIRLQEETFVSINGVNFKLPKKEWLDVPEQIADILAESGRI